MDKRENKLTALSDWTDEDFAILDQIGQGPKIVVDPFEDQVTIPTDAEITEWSEDADALDSLTEEWKED